jgi:hypothetical protein
MVSGQFMSGVAYTATSGKAPSKFHELLTSQLRFVLNGLTSLGLFSDLLIARKHNGTEDPLS